jgi:hypothetical protein
MLRELAELTGLSARVTARRWSAPVTARRWSARS